MTENEQKRQKAIEMAYAQYRPEAEALAAKLAAEFVAQGYDQAELSTTIEIQSWRPDDDRAGYRVVVTAPTGVTKSDTTDNHDLWQHNWPAEALRLWQKATAQEKAEAQARKDKEQEETAQRNAERDRQEAEHARQCEEEQKAEAEKIAQGVNLLRDWAQYDGSDLLRARIAASNAGRDVAWLGLAESEYATDHAPNDYIRLDSYDYTEKQPRRHPTLPELEEATKLLDAGFADVSHVWYILKDDYGETRTAWASVDVAVPTPTGRTFVFSKKFENI